MTIKRMTIVLGVFFFTGLIALCVIFSDRITKLPNTAKDFMLVRDDRVIAVFVGSEFSDRHTCEEVMRFVQKDRVGKYRCLYVED